MLAPQTETGLYHQLGAALATGNTVAIDATTGLQDVLRGLPQTVLNRIKWADDWRESGPFSGALIEGDASRVKLLNQKIADLPGPLVLVQAATSEALQTDKTAYCLNWLLEEVSTSINTAAAGGNASLMAIS